MNYYCVYRTESRTEANCIAINETLLTVSKLVSISYDGALICGDFNYHQIKWTSEGITHIDGPMDSLAYQFASTLDECHFNQAVRNPTFQMDENCLTNVLDLIITECRDRIYDVSYNPSLTTTKKAI